MLHQIEIFKSMPENTYSQRLRYPSHPHEIQSFSLLSFLALKT